MPKHRKTLKAKNVRVEHDWGLAQKEKWVMLEVGATATADTRLVRPVSFHFPVCSQIRNSHWQSMRFSQLLLTSEPLDRVRQLIMDKHGVVSSESLRLFLGTECSAENLLKLDDYSLTLSELSIIGGSRNDHVEQIITYSYAPYTPYKGSEGCMGVLALPRGITLAPLKANLR